MSDVVTRAKVSLGLAAGVAAVTILGVFLWARHPAVDQAPARSSWSAAGSRPVPVAAAYAAAVQAPGAADAATPDRPAAAGAAAERQPAVPATAALTFVADASIPLAQRQERLAELARRGDESATKTLMAIADANVYTSAAAVRALGQVRTPAAAQYLAGKLGPDANIRIVCAAVQSLAEIEGEKAIAAIGECVAANHRRPDGLEQLVWKECASTLAGLRSPAALPILQRELEWVGAAARELEYGTQLVAAVAKLGDAAGAPLLERYAADLAAKLPTEPRPKAYFEERIKEAQAAADRLRQPAAKPAQP